MKQRKQSNNRGFSLVELIVIVLILGILAVSATISISQIAKANVTSCAKKLANVLDKARLETISKTGTVKLELSYVGNVYLATVIIRGVRQEPVELGSGSIDLTLRNTLTLVDDDIKSTVANIEFSKGSGAYYNTPYDRIEVRNGSKCEYVYLVQDTGRCFISSD